MALAIASVSTVVAQGSTTSLAVNYPTSVAIGNLLLMHVSNEGTVTTPNGWTLAQSQTSSGTPNFTTYLFWKIAEAGDVGQSTLAVTVSNAPSAGAMFRITGHDATTPVGADNSGYDGGSATTSVSISGVTPAKILNYIMVFMVARRSGDSTVPTTSAYAIATTPPSFSEHYDQVMAQDEGVYAYAIASASGARNVATATGNATATLSDTSRYAAIIAAISPADESNTVTPAAGSATANGPTPGLLVSTTAIADAGAATATAPAPTLSSQEFPAFTNPDKSSTSWTNPDKTQ